MAAGIRIRRPAIAVMFMSSYADAQEDRDLALAGEGLFLPKPFTAAALRDIVARAAGEQLPARVTRRPGAGRVQQP